VKTFKMKWNGVNVALPALVFAGIFAFTTVSFAAGGGMGGGGGMENGPQGPIGPQ
jgi:hypothetical protein